MKKVGKSVAGPDPESTVASGNAQDEEMAVADGGPENANEQALAISLLGDVDSASD